MTIEEARAIAKEIATTESTGKPPVLHKAKFIVEIAKSHTSDIEDGRCPSSTILERVYEHLED